MAKFCSNCGRPLDENVRFCGSCGTPIPVQQTPVQPEPQPQPQYVPPQPQPQYVQTPPPPQPPKKKSKTAGIAIAISAVVIIAAVLLTLFLTGTIGGKKDKEDSSNTPEGAVKTFVNAMIDGDAEKAVDSMPSFYWLNNDKTKQELINAIEENIIDDLEYYDQISYKIISVEDIEEYRLNRLKSSFVESFGDDESFDLSDITGYKTIEVEISIVIDGEKDIETGELLVVKYKGNWKIIPDYGY